MGEPSVLKIWKQPRSSGLRGSLDSGGDHSRTHTVKVKVENPQGPAGQQESRRASTQKKCLIEKSWNTAQQHRTMQYSIYKVTKS